MFVRLPIPLGRQHTQCLILAGGSAALLDRLVARKHRRARQHLACMTSQEGRCDRALPVKLAMPILVPN